MEDLRWQYSNTNKTFIWDDTINDSGAGTVTNSCCIMVGEITEVDVVAEAKVVVVRANLYLLSHLLDHRIAQGPVHHVLAREETDG